MNRTITSVSEITATLNVKFWYRNYRGKIVLQLPSDIEKEPVTVPID